MYLQTICIHICLHACEHYINDYCYKVNTTVGLLHEHLLLSLAVVLSLSLSLSRSLTLSLILTYTLKYSQKYPNVLESRVMIPLRVMRMCVDSSFYHERDRCVFDDLSCQMHLTMTLVFFWVCEEILKAPRLVFLLCDLLVRVQKASAPSLTHLWCERLKTPWRNNNARLTTLEQEKICRETQASKHNKAVTVRTYVLMYAYWCWYALWIHRRLWHVDFK